MSVDDDFTREMFVRETGMGAGVLLGGGLARPLQAPRPYRGRALAGALRPLVPDSLRARTTYV